MTMHLRPRILLYGDSLTQRAFADGPNKVGWASLLASAYIRRADVLNRGFSGYNTTHALELLPRIFGSSQSSDGNEDTGILFATVFFGANDCALPGERQHVPLEEYSSNLRKIVEGIRATTKANYPIILITPPPIDGEAWRAELGFDHCDRTNETARAYGLEAKRVAKELGCPALDTWELFRGDKPGFENRLCDGLHLNDSGNELIYEGLMQLLKDNFPTLAPAELIDGKYQGEGLQMEEKLWDELC